MSLRLPAAALAVVLLAFSAGTVLAAAPSAAPGHNKIQCFAGGDATCTLNSKGAKGSATLAVNAGGVAGWANWAAFAAAHPTWEVALTDNYLFAIADEPGTWTLNNVTIGKPGK